MKYTNAMLYFKVLALIPLCISIVLAAYSLLLGWNLITLIVFWFFIVPFLTLFLSSRLLKEDHVTAKTMVSLTAFYSLMVFMIYEHFQSDYFAVMMFSFLYNFLILGLVMFVQRHDRISQGRHDAH